MTSAGDVDMSLHGTYYVLPRALVCLAMAALLALFAGAYSVFSFNPRAAAWHFRLTIASIAVYWVSFYLWGAWAGGRAGIQGLMHGTTPPLGTAIMALFVLSTLAVLASPLVSFVSFALGWAGGHDEAASPRTSA